MRISRKLTFGFLTPSLLALVLGLVAVRLCEMIAVRAEYIYKNSLQKVEYLIELQDNVRTPLSLVRRFLDENETGMAAAIHEQKHVALIKNTDFSMEQFKIHLDGLRETVQQGDELAGKLRKEGREKEELEVIEKMEEHFLAYTFEMSLLLSLVDEDAHAAEHILERLLHTELFALLDENLLDSKEELEGRILDIKLIAGDVQRAILFVTVCIVVISYLLGLFFARTFSEPLRKLQQGTEALKRGEWNVRINISARDEFGDLASSFNTMVEELAEKSELRAILDSLSEGLFPINERFEIGALYSPATEDIFLQKNPGGKNFLELLAGMFSESLFVGVRDYLKLLFRKDLDEEMLADLNPVTRVEASIAGPEAVLVTKFLEFRFRRIYEEGEIARVLVVVRDVTEQKVLAKRLRATSDRNRAGGGALFDILQVEPCLLNDFIKDTKCELDVLDGLLLRSGERTNENLNGLLHDIYLSVYAVRLDADLLGVAFIQAELEPLLERIEELLEKKELSGMDFLALTVMLAGFRDSLKGIQILLERLKKLEPGGELEENIVLFILQAVGKVVRRLGLELDKEVEFAYGDFDYSRLPVKLNRVLRMTLTQLASHALLHGIEGRDERDALRKERAGRIVVTGGLRGNCFWVRFRDDGRGLEWRPTLGESGGRRSLNMEAFRRRLEMAGGRIEAEFIPDQSCEFKVELPV